MNNIDKPLLSAEELINKMKTKGITFKYCTEEQAITFLQKNNNYFRISSYRKMYDKYPSGSKKGQYRYLDFEYLRDLSTIDMHLRFLVIKMCLDIEHYLKIDLLSTAEQIHDDGYKIIDQFFSESKYQYIKKNIYYKKNSTYCCDLLHYCFEFDDNNATISNYQKCRLWDLFECLTFGDFLRFYEFYYNRCNKKSNYLSLIPCVKSLRNACAHNNCILSQLRKNDCIPSKTISTFIASIKGISNNVRKTQLKKRFIYEITCLLYLYNLIVPKIIKTHRFSELKDLVNNRMPRNSNYYQNQQIIKSSYSFIKKIVDNL